MANLPPGFDFDCAAPLSPLVLAEACTAQLTGAQCDPGETLFDVLDPTTFCSSCETTFVSAFTAANSTGCCTYDTLYLMNADSTCNDGGEYLSFTGLSDTIEYFCTKVEVTVDEATSDFYCLTDGQAYATATGPSVSAAGAVYDPENPATIPTALEYFNDGVTLNGVTYPGVSCSYVQQSACCFASLLNYAEGCGGTSKAAQAEQLEDWITAVNQFCAAQSTPTNIAALCDDLEEDLSTCLAADDNNCEGKSPPEDDDDSASSIVTSTLAGLFAAVAGLAAFTRKF